MPWSSEHDAACRARGSKKRALAEDPVFEPGVRYFVLPTAKSSITKPSAPRRETKTGLVRAWFLERPFGWFALFQVAEGLGIRVEAANYCVNALCERGELERLLSVAEGRRKGGQRYRWKGHVTAKD